MILSSGLQRSLIACLYSMFISVHSFFRSKTWTFIFVGYGFSQCVPFYRMEETMNEENTEEVRALQTQIKCLQAEVASLQVQRQHNQEDIRLDLRGQLEEAMCVSLNSQQSI